MKAKNCLPCHNWIIAQKRRHPSPICMDCGKTVFRLETKRCQKCNTKNMVLNPPNPNLNPKKGDKHPCWKGGVCKCPDGHIYRKVTDHPFANARGYVFEHRLVMEKYLGRFLSRGEIVHHINGKHFDNRIENLELLSKREHSIIHSPNLRKFIHIRDTKTGRFIS
jgi:uncharacterized protein (DUF1330 family)